MFLVLSLAQVAVDPITDPPALSFVVAVGSALPLAWRRVHPAAAALTMTAAWLIPPDDGFLLLGYVIAVLAVLLPRRAHGAAGGGRRGVRRRDGGRRRDDAPRPRARRRPPSVPPWSFSGRPPTGRLVAHQRRQTALLEELTGRLVQERATAERAAVAEERARIARELHDVIGHEVTVIALQADAAAAALAKAPERAAAPVEAIRRSAAEALAEMRRVVGMLRAAEEEDLRPQPGLPDVPALVEQSRAAGSRRRPHLAAAGPADARQRRAGRLPARPGGADQRAPARAGRAGRRPRRGRRRRGARRGRQRAAGRDPLAPAAGPSGFGLVGMRERVRMLGGRLDAGPTDGGGYALTARLPLELPVAP